MTQTDLTRSLTALAFHFIALAGIASAQCPEWSSAFHLPGADNDVRAGISFGGSPGAPDLIIGGTFDRVNGIAARRLARWNGTSWSEAAAVGVGNASPHVSSLTVWDSGSGPELYVGGSFTNIGGVTAEGIARWNGTTWSPLGLGVSGTVYAMTVFDDGSGPALFVGGAFTVAGGMSAARIAKWNGSAWSTVGPSGANGAVYALEVHDAGTGPALYAGGDFSFLGVSTNRVSRWNGTAWTSVPGNPNGAVLALESWNDGTGPGLYACGDFSQYQGSAWGIARWNGTAWAAVGGGLTVTSGFPYISAVRKFDDGTGEALYVSGQMNFAGGNPASGIAKWNGTAWSALGSGLSTTSSATGAISLATWDVSGAARLIAGGFFSNAGGSAVQGLAAWAGAWSTLGSGAGVTGPVYALTLHDDGSGPAMFAAGNFLAVAGSPNTIRIGKWTGVTWAPLGSGADGTIEDLISFNDGSGPALFAAGGFANVGGVASPRCAKWNGSVWSNASVGLTPGPHPLLVVYDDGTGPGLYDLRALQKWNGTSWVATTWMPPISRIAATTVQETSGESLYISGTRTVLMMPDRRVSKFDGTNWTIIGDAFDVEPHWLCAFDDGTGPTVYAFGLFTMVGATPIASAAKWDGAAWVAMGSGLVGNLSTAGDVRATASTPAFGMSGPKLYVGGTFVSAGGNAALNLASWDGATWSGVDGGTNAAVHALSAVNQPSGPELFAGGTFTFAGGKSSARIARYASTCTLLTSFCAGDGSGTACPCANLGSAGRGCASSSFAQGAVLSTSGLAGASAATDSLVLTASDITGPGLFFQGTGQFAGGAGISFGDGLLCAGGTITRMGVVFPTGNSASYPGGLTPSPIHIAGATTSGDVRTYQCWYRDAPMFCSPSTFNLTQGVSLTWGL
ncbi:MAG: hypothetical protein JNL28_16780 [Planctomycetes bacterium]|nr:hypothetical protein [Planctomycetota bacterium]